MGPRHVMLAVLVAAIWGFNFISIDAGLGDLPPFLFAALRFVVTALPLVFFVRRPRVRWTWFVAIGLLLGAGQFGLLFLGMREGMPPGLASLVLQSQALFTILIAGAFLRERLRPVQSLGVLIAFVGIAVIGADFGRASPVFAFLLCIGAAAMWGGANVLIKRMNQTTAEPVDAFAFMIWMSLVPPVPLFALSVAVEGWGADLEALSSMTLGGVAAVGYIAYVSTIVGFGLWGWLMRRHNAGTVAVYSLLVPPFGMTFAALILGEQFSALKLVAAVLIIVGVAVATVQFKLRRSRLDRVPAVVAAR